MEMPVRDLSDTRIIIPVRNGGLRWREVVEALRDCLPTPSSVVVIDSGSTDGSDAIAAHAGFEVVSIEPRLFNHGGTRQKAIELFCHGKAFAVFLTHDAVINGRASLTELLAAFNDSSTGAAYGRQLPHYNAKPFAQHNAAYLYGNENSTRALSDAARLGLRTTHLSNSFAAYRLQALSESGGFPDGLILGEDAVVALRLLRCGWTIRYQARATVRHSHDYSLLQEMRRYFDYGVFHTQMPDFVKVFGSAEGEGSRFVISELRYMAKHAPWLIPMAPLRNAAKYAGYRLGRSYRRLPDSVRRLISMTRGYWDSVATSRQ